jgi:two-component system response regulator HydG
VAADEAPVSDALVALLGESEPMRRLREQARRLAPTGLPVLVCGETGTGKEVLARALHEASGRPGPFVAVDCAALASSLVESELFGHARGAFTGAVGARAGLAAAADGGTLFLDEVGELSLEVQTRLLRLLEAGTFRPVGAEEERRVDLRVVAATWRDLGERVRGGAFRRDLFHRLAVAELVIPPLRARDGDVERLLDAFLAEEAALAGRPAPRLAAATRAHLLRWPWPGNVRELRNVARYIAALARGREVELEDLPKRLRVALEPPAAAAAAAVRVDLPYLEARRVWLDEFQHRYVTAILAAHGGNVSAAARASGMDRRSIQRVLKRLAEEP